MTRENLIQQFSMLVKHAIKHNTLRDIYVFLHLVKFCESLHTGYRVYLEEYEGKEIDNTKLLYTEIRSASYDFLAESQNSIIRFQMENGSRLRFIFESHFDNFKSCDVSEEVAQITFRMQDPLYFKIIKGLAKNYTIYSNEFYITIDEFIGKTKIDNYKNTLKELLA